MFFLAPLIEAMVQRNPKNRPSSEEALKLFEELVSQQSDSSLRWRLITPDMGRVSRLMVDMRCMCRERLLIAKNFLGEFGGHIKSSLLKYFVHPSDSPINSKPEVTKVSSGKA